jgi:thiol:disulfide interchange protein DsbA
VPLLTCLLLFAAGAQGGPQWVEGTHYFLITPAQPTSVGEGQVEVTEAFSYGCPACNAFEPVMQKLEASLPANAVLTHVPASFIPREQWPLFQRAFYTAKALNIVGETHQEMYDAIWKTGELAVVDYATHRLLRTPPDIEDVARFYAGHAEVTEQQFLDTAKSFSVALDMRRADDWIEACHVDRTPTIVVNGKYRVHGQSAGSANRLIELVNWLVAQESAAGAPATGAPDAP